MTKNTSIQVSPQISLIQQCYQLHLLVPMSSSVLIQLSSKFLPFDQPPPTPPPPSPWQPVSVRLAFVQVPHVGDIQAHPVVTKGNSEGEREGGRPLPGSWGSGQILDPVGRPPRSCMLCGCRSEGRQGSSGRWAVVSSPHGAGHREA